MTLNRATLDALNRLHKGYGVRKHNLYSELGPLRGLWNIDTADASEVLARTIIRMRRSISRLGPTEVAIASASYNLDPDPELTPLKHGDRIEVLSKRLGKGHSVTSLGRDLKDAIRAHIEANLSKPCEPITSQEIEEVLDQERSSAAPMEQPAPGPAIPNLQQPTPEASLSSSISIMQGPRAAADYVVQRFLASPLLVPRNDKHVAAVADMADFGTWICVFEDPGRLDAYRRIAKPDWDGTPLTMTGAELIAHLQRRGRRVGILVNPLADLDGDLTGTLPLPPELVEELQEERKTER